MHQRECCMSCGEIFEVAILYSAPRSTPLCRQRPFAVTGSVPCLFTAIRRSDATCHICMRYLYDQRYVHSKNKEAAVSCTSMLAIASYAHIQL